MGTFLDTVPVSAIIRIRDLMLTLKDPFRLDQGDVSFDAPDSVKQAMAKAITDNRSHYLPTTGVPRLRELLAEKMRTKNGIPIGSPEEIVPTNGGTHAIWAALHALFEPGDEMIVSDPEWPPTMAIWPRRPALACARRSCRAPTNGAPARSWISRPSANGM